LKPVHITK